MKGTTMKLKKLWISLLIVAMCGTAHANPELLEKFRTPGQQTPYEGLLVDLYEMQAAALPFLIKTLTDENQQARERALEYIKAYYPEPRALPALTTFFLNNTYEWMHRRDAAFTIARIDTEYAKKLFQKHLYTDSVTQNIIVDVLIHLKDEQVIPLLVKRLEDTDGVETEPQFTLEGHTEAATRLYVAEVLAEFNDKRAIPALMSILHDTEHLEKFMLQRATVALARFDDPLILPTLVKFYTEHVSRSIPPKWATINATNLQAILKVLEQTKIEKGREDFKYAIRYPTGVIPQIIPNGVIPQIIPIYEKLYYETDDTILRKSEILNVLQNMGPQGLEALLRIAEKEPTDSLFFALKTFHSPKAIDVVATFALNRDSALQKTALYRLAAFSPLHKAEITKYVPQLLDDPDPSIRELTFGLIRILELTEFAPDIKRFTRHSDKYVQNTAHFLLDELTGKPQLILKAEPDKPQFEYGQPITLRYRGKNVANYPIKIGFAIKARTIERMNIQKPDGTRADYRGVHVDYAVLGKDAYKTLKPGQEITDTLTISLSTHPLYQIGTYTAQIHLIPHGGAVNYETITYPYTLTAKTDFNINPPTVAYVDNILDQIAADNIINPDETYYQLTELKKSGVFPRLQTRAFIPFTPSTPSVYREFSITSLYNEELMKLSNDAFIEKYYELALGNMSLKRTQPIMAYGDAPSIQILQYEAISGNVEAALQLKELGNDSYITWCKQLSEKNLTHDDKPRRLEAAKNLMRIQQLKYVDTQRGEYNSAITYPEFYERNETLQLAAQWAQIVEKVATLDGLKELLKHEIPAVRRGAAYQLAFLGDAAGADIIQEDLHANRSDTRYYAARVLLNIKSK